ncbi:MAG TPA: shikimate dehydrogenase [Acidimicrobiales bacterium]|nr:shikimate dehydrogenase [Acidimicrobiales bacterium]
MSAAPWAPGGLTRVAAVIGHPVRHSLSPVIHNAAFRHLDLDWVYVALDVAPGNGRVAVEAMRTLGLAGLNVTMPHKADVAAAVDRLSPVASALGAVNTVVAQGRTLTGESTDGAGLLAALAADHGFDPSERRCLVLGAGGAARAVVLALAEGGAKEVVVVARRREQAARAATLAGSVGRAGMAADVADVDLLVNATPVGDQLPLGVRADDLGAGQLVVDLLYAPATTVLMDSAEARGAATANGVGMLVHQAALSFQLWTGEEMPLDAVRLALATGPGGRGR